MSSWDAIKTRVNRIPIGKNFERHDIVLSNNDDLGPVNYPVVSQHLAKLIQAKCVERVNRGVYKRLCDIPGSLSSSPSKSRKSETVDLSDKSVEEIISGEEDDDNPQKHKHQKSNSKLGVSQMQKDTAGNAVLGKKEKSIILEKLTRQDILDLICGNDIKFEVTLKCTNVQRNFQGHIIGFSLMGVDVSVKDGEVK